MTRLDMTPWARSALSPADRDYIDREAPQNATVHIGKGSRGWACRILVGGVVVGDAFHHWTPMAAFRAALADMGAKAAANA